MSTDQDQLAALLAAVADTPDEDAPRLILADWLEEHGERARAEFIRKECEYHPLPSYDPRREKLMRRAEQLLSRNKETWLGTPPADWELNTQRGLLVAEVTGSAVTEVLRDPWWPAHRKWLGRLQCDDCSDKELQPVLSGDALDGLPELWIHSDRATDKSLKDLGRRPHLQRLQLCDCRVGDAGLEQVATLKRLQSLCLFDCQRVTNAALEALSALDGLRSLQLGDCRRLTDRGLKILASLGQLRELLLSHSDQFTDKAMKHLAGLQHLQKFNLSWNDRISDAGLEILAGLGALQDLELASTGITDAGMGHLAGLTNLRRLDLGNTRMTDAGVAALANLKCLEELSLSDTKVTDAGLQHLAGLPRLRALDLFRTRLTGAAVRILSGMSELRELNLFGCDGLPKGGPARVRKALPQCTVRG
jgi:uncharacterized protein (TIGR02996 family)